MYDLEFGGEVTPLLVVFHTHLCFELIVFAQNHTLLYGGFIKIESVELIFVYLHEGCGKTIAKKTSTFSLKDLRKTLSQYVTSDGISRMIFQMSEEFSG